MAIAVLPEYESFNRIVDKVAETVAALSEKRCSHDYIHSWFVDEVLDSSEYRALDEHRRNDVVTAYQACSKFVLASMCRYSVSEGSWKYKTGEWYA